jgi:hypothetical protein
MLKRPVTVVEARLALPVTDYLLMRLSLVGPGESHFAPDQVRQIVTEGCSLQRAARARRIRPPMPAPSPVQNTEVNALTGGLPACTWVSTKLQTQVLFMQQRDGAPSTKE